MQSDLLCEVFGHPINSNSPDAIRHRTEKLCPFNNKSPHCTKVSVPDPLGVCSMFASGEPIILCPVRFRQNWIIISDALSFLLPNHQLTNYVTEATIKDLGDDEVGSIDAVLVEHTPDGSITDFGILEIQAVYISGNIRKPFRLSMGETDSWDGKNAPRPDWLSSVKRLIRQLTVKGVIFKSWNKKMAVAVQKQFYESHMPQLRNIESIPVSDADVAWFLYDLIFNPEIGVYELKLERTIYMSFETMLDRFSKIEAGSIDGFNEVLEKKLKNKLGIKPPRKPRKKKVIPVQIELPLE